MRAHIMLARIMPVFIMPDFYYYCRLSVIMWYCADTCTLPTALT